MKRILTIILTLMLLTSLTPIAAATTIDIKINDQYIASDVSPFVYEGRTMVPLRAITEALGATSVLWDEGQRWAVILYENKQYIFKIDSLRYWINGVPSQTDVGPMMVENRVMVPLRAVAEAMGFEVAWDQRLKIVTITKEEHVVPDRYITQKTYDEESLLWLARIVTLEGRGISYEAKLAIANVVLNRVASSEYPNTVYDVIKDTGYTVQFPPAHRDDFDSLEPTDEAVAAAKAALSGDNNIEGCLYFNNTPFKWKAEDLCRVIDGEYFYY